MKKTVIVALISAFLVTGCAIGFMGGHHGRSMVIVPALPEMVELDADQYYSQNGYYYMYQGNVWVYSESRQGPWSQLPRSHYPREVRYRGHDEHDQGNRDQGNRDHDNRDHDNQQHR
jgi:hypothetical protein